MQLRVLRGCAAGLAFIALTAVGVFGQAQFYPISSVSVVYPQGGPYFPEFNLIQGPGIGFDAVDPYDALLFGGSGAWVTDAFCFPCDYIANYGAPVITLDLGKDRELDEISVWGYSADNANGVKDFSLRFATNLDGPTGFGTSVTYNPIFEELEADPLFRQSLPLAQKITARYVEFTPLATFFTEPGDGSTGGLAGGDRIGLGEIAFEAPDGVIIDPLPPGREYYTIESIDVTTSDTDLYPIDNLIQGPGTGFLDRDPYVKLLSDNLGNWVTEECGYPCDYLETFDPPVITLDLGEDVDLNEIHVWGYSSANDNGVSEFQLRFATQADGENGFGTSIAFNPTFSELENDGSKLQVLPFGQSVKARYVEFTATDNFFVDPGNRGGDRMGLGEIAFPVPSATIPGDNDGNGLLEAADLDLQAAQIVLNPVPPPAGYDLNNDGAVNFDDREVWLHDLKNTWVGDANLDGVFTSDDFVQVFAAGKYEVVGASATWEEGDWNGDQAFSSADFVAAFADGGYETGPRPGAVSAVPEPASAWLLLLGLVGLARRKRVRA